MVLCVALGGPSLTPTLPARGSGVVSAAGVPSATRPASRPGGSAPLFEDSGIRLPIAGSLAWGDYDGDGDLDIVLAGHDEKGTPAARIYENRNGRFVPVRADLPGVWAGDVAWGDLDNDGDLDLALAGQTDRGPISRVFRNEGGRFAEVPVKLAGAAFSGLAWGDTDGDDRPDLAVGGSNRLQIYENERGELRQQDVTLGGVQFASLDWGDFDGDGDLDLAVGGEYHTGTAFRPVSRILVNEGAGGFVPADAGLPSLANSSVAWADYDGDGDLDLAISGFDASTAVSCIFRNDGTGKLAAIDAGLTGLGAGDVAWGDFDADGDPDLAIAGFYNDADLGPQCRTLIYRNDRENAFAKLDARIVGLQYADLDWGDYDGDGDLDLAVTGVTCDYKPVTRIYRNTSRVPRGTGSRPH